MFRDLPQQEVFFVRQPGGTDKEEAGRAGRFDRRLDLLPDVLDAVGNVDVANLTAMPDRGLLDFKGVEALGEEAPVVADPVIVDERLDARQEAIDDVIAGLDRDVAADVASRADRRSLIEVPDAFSKTELLDGQGPHRAHIGGAPGPVVSQRLSVVRPDESAAAAVEKGQLRGLGDLLTEADAARALDAAGHVGDDMRTNHRPVEARVLALGLVELRELLAVAERVVLERALSRLIADGAIERMVDEQKLHRRRARLPHLLRRCFDGKTVFERRRASGLDFRDAFDLDQTHPALPDDGEPRVITEVRDFDTGELGGVDEVHVLRDLDRLAVEDDRERVLGGSGSTAHAVTSALDPTRHRLC